MNMEQAKETEVRNVVSMRGIVKRFPGVIANDQVDFDLRAGEVHALLGENGAGKSTLMNVLAGLYKPESGIVEVNNKPVDFSSPRDAIEAGIGMVHQHFMLVPSQSVTENILLGLDEPRFRMNLSQYNRKIANNSVRWIHVNLQLFVGRYLPNAVYSRLVTAVHSQKFNFTSKGRKKV